ncbi:MAG: hypothetical protein ACO3F3_06035 [Gemmataceae bacterium]
MLHKRIKIDDVHFWSFSFADGWGYSIRIRQGDVVDEKLSTQVHSSDASSANCHGN